MGTGGKERPRRDADHSPPTSAEVKNVRAIPPLTPCASMVCSGITLPFTITDSRKLKCVYSANSKQYAHLNDL
jgi:hypothetical protein